CWKTAMPSISSPVSVELFPHDSVKENRFDLLTTTKHAKAVQNQGKVYLVGAGTGDPELLTIKAYKTILQADVICYDNLVSDEILALNTTAEKIYVGKKCHKHSMSQQDINELLVTLAQQGKTIVRLKSGDPFIFGRGGEEMQTVVSAGIACESIAGITTALAVANSVNIPLTHRDYAQSVKFVTGFLKTDTPNDQYAELLADNQTVIFYMGLNTLPNLTQGLLQAGKSADTPFAIIANVSRPNEQVLVATLSTIQALQNDAKLPSPAVMIMGDVVSLYHQLNAPTLTYAAL
ncbi:uroporphyrinogen-III C-methyltransferase, partial [Salmonella enterica subsp. enterica serovar Enteritidis]|nr:uroporphyrinogen-III C-methyltransferase [Salmonella enterica subsp. enterica serovar Enteritidis]